MLAEQVAAGTLPPVDERLPLEPRVAPPVEEVGTYGGTLNVVSIDKNPWNDVTESPGRPLTEVDYELTIDLAVPLPGFVKRRAEDKIVKSALHRFKLRVEDLSGRN